MSGLFLDPHWAIPVSVFVGGLIGSPHCMMMCGPIVLNFAGSRDKLIVYQLGRLLGYTAVGAVAGGIGQTVLSPDRVPWLSTVSILMIAILLIVNGVRAYAGKPLHFALPRTLAKFSATFWKALRPASRPRHVSAALAGLFTVLLPCGHLYSFLLGAVATGSAMRGAVFMFAFWLGSTPLLSFGGTWVQKILRPRLKNGQRWAGAILISAGIVSVVAFGFRRESGHDHHREAARESSASAGESHCH